MEAKLGPLVVGSILCGGQGRHVLIAGKKLEYIFARLALVLLQTQFETLYQT